MLSDNMHPIEKSIERFNQDVAERGGYVYSTTGQLSSKLANARVSRAIRKVADLAGKRVVDIGCGDGTYTIELLDYEPSYVLGIEPAREAVESAQENTANITNMDFRVCDIYNLGKLNDHFDVAVLRGVIHHLYDPEEGIRNLAEFADCAIIVEPNGLNPALKILEKVSRYHIEHEEKSYIPSTVDAWFESCGATLESREFLSIVPYLCPDWIARILNIFEPLVENFPLLNRIGCGQTVQFYRFR